MLFTGLVEPTDMQHGWSIQCTPQPSILLGTYNAIIAADGKQKSLPGFHFNQFRAQLALAITVNFVNRNTQQENTTDEISGVSFVYNQEFFNNLSEKHGIELENIVYYKDETHYFVMTAKKSSLLKKAVIKQVTHVAMVFYLHAISCNLASDVTRDHTSTTVGLKFKCNTIRIDAVC